jgi:hypothetical protein
MVEFQIRQLFVGARMEDHGGHHMVFEPSADPEESEIMPLFHSSPHRTKEPERRFGIIGLD